MAKRPRDPNQLAKLVVDIASGEASDEISERKRMEPKRGRSGGLRGGVARSRKLTPERKVEIARVAADARWNKKQMRLAPLGSPPDLPGSGDSGP